MKPGIKKIGKVLKSVAIGVADVLFPNVKQSFKLKESDFKDDDGKKFEIDFPRLITAITVWIILLLVFFGKIKFSDVVDLLSELLQ